MSEQSAKRLKISYHAFITLFAIGVILSSVLGYEEMERATMYIILGIGIGGNSLFQIFKIVKKK